MGAPVTQCWIVFCPEKRHPGLWGCWRDGNCVAIGWPTRKYFEAREKDGWGMARSCLERMKGGDVVVPYLGDFRLGIPGRIKAFHVEDHEWHPTTSITKSRPKGDLGRRIDVEWRKEGVPDPDKIVHIPKTARNGPVTRPTLRSLKPEHYEDLLGYILNSANWIDYPERHRA